MSWKQWAYINSGYNEELIETEHISVFTSFAINELTF